MAIHVAILLEPIVESVWIQCQALIFGIILEGRLKSYLEPYRNPNDSPDAVLLESTSENSIGAPLEYY